MIVHLAVTASLLLLLLMLNLGVSCALGRLAWSARQQLPVQVTVPASQSDLAAFSQRHWALSGTSSSTSFVSLFNFKLVFLLSASSLTDRAGNYLLPSTYAPSPLRRRLRLRRLCIVHYQMDDDSRSHCGHHCPPLVMSFNSILTAL